MVKISRPARLWQLLLALNRQRMLIAYSLGLKIEQATSEYSYVEIAALTILKKKPHHGTALAQEVGIEQSWMSRVLSGLRESGCIALSAREGNKSMYALTKKGEKALKESEGTFSKIATALTEPLSKSQCHRLTQLCHLLADALNVPPSLPEDTMELELEEALDRLARFFGVFGSKVRTSSLSLMEWQVLDLLFTNEQMPQQEIECRLAYDQGALSRLAQAWGKNGIVTQTTSPLDTRHKIVTLTSEGKALYTNSLEVISRPLQRGMKVISEKDTAELFILLAKISETPRHRTIDSVKKRKGLVTTKTLDQKELADLLTNVTTLPVVNEDAHYIGAFRLGEFLGVGILCPGDRSPSLTYMFPSLLQAEDEFVILKAIRAAFAEL